MSETKTVSPLRQRMIEDMAARKLNPNTQRSHIYSCKRFAAWTRISDETAVFRQVECRGPHRAQRQPHRQTIAMDQRMNFTRQAAA